MPELLPAPPGQPQHHGSSAADGLLRGAARQQLCLNPGPLVPLLPALLLLAVSCCAGCQHCVLGRTRSTGAHGAPRSSPLSQHIPEAEGLCFPALGVLCCCCLRGCVARAH